MTDDDYTDEQLEDEAQKALTDLPGPYRVVLTVEVEADNVTEASQAMSSAAARMVAGGFRVLGGELWLEDGRIAEMGEPTVQSD